MDFSELFSQRSGPLPFRSPVVGFLACGHLAFGMSADAIPVDDVRVKSCVNSFFVPPCLPVSFPKFQCC